MQQADLYQPIVGIKPGAPLVIRTVIKQQGTMLVGGVPASTQKIENYVLLSALPVELRQRVELAVQMLLQGG